jgi:hypothetical protein
MTLSGEQSPKIRRARLWTVSFAHEVEPRKKSLFVIMNRARRFSRRLYRIRISFVVMGSPAIPATV